MPCVQMVKPRDALAGKSTHTELVSWPLSRNHGDRDAHISIPEIARWGVSVRVCELLAGR